MDGPAGTGPAGAWADVAAAAGAEAGDVDPDLLGGFLPELARVAADGHRLPAAELARAGRLGERAGEAGVPLRDLVDLYLSAAWRAWRRLPRLAEATVDAVAVQDLGEAVLRAVDDTVAAVGDGYVAGRRAVVRREEAQRREFLDDLFAGTGDPAPLAARAESLGLDLAGPRQVALVRGSTAFREATALVTRIGRAVVAATGPASPDPLVTTRQGMLVAALPAGSTADPESLVSALTAALDRALPGDPARRVALGGVHPDAAGVGRSFAEARDALALAGRLGLAGPLVRSRDLLVYRVLLRDSTAMGELIDAVLGPLAAARGGAGPLLDTIRAHAEAGGNSSATARALHLSVRAVTYRLSRIAELTGRNPVAPADAYVLATAAIGARALGWPPSANRAGHHQRSAADPTGRAPDASFAPGGFLPPDAATPGQDSATPSRPETG